MIDTLRCTGRTTRMLNAALLCSDERIRIVGKTSQHAVNLASILCDMEIKAEQPAKTIECMGKDQFLEWCQLGLSGLRTFVDHEVFDYA